LNARWPAWHARLANFLMQDPLREPRERLVALYAETGSPEPQRELFS
ncbi:MAG: glycosyltransferase, partial [Pseudoxanthomonas sp.]